MKESSERPVMERSSLSRNTNVRHDLYKMRSKSSRIRTSCESLNNLVDALQDDFPNRRLSNPVGCSSGRRSRQFSITSYGSDSTDGFNNDDISIDMGTVDLAQNYGRGIALERGRESHTADLHAFDAYTERMKRMDRGAVSIAQDFGYIDTGGDSDSDYYDDDDVANTFGDRPFHAEFWSFVRSILEKAQPAGFEEVDDPTVCVQKNAADNAKFIEKAVGTAIINPIQPASLAEAGGFCEDTVLTELLYATKVGLVTMRFAPECYNCGSPVCSKENIGELPSESECNACNELNKIDSLDLIKVLFLFGSDVLYVLADHYPCTPSKQAMGLTEIFAIVPATSTGSGFSYVVGSGDDQELRQALEPGRYQMHCPVAGTDNYLTVERKATNSDKPVHLRFAVSEIIREKAPGEFDLHEEAVPRKKKELSAPHGKIYFDILPDTRSFFVLWVMKDVGHKMLTHLPEEERGPYTTATRVMHNRAFNRLFKGQQVVRPDPEGLFAIKNVVLVFTDVVGSTNLYASLGDGDAFRLVRKHFQVLFGAFTKRGRVIKTVGDAVMASFITGRDAMEAVADVLRLLPMECIRPDNNQPLEIRVGIHCGPATIVPLNGVNDYFGQTVNVAARIEGAANSSECFVTDAVLSSDPDSKKAYDEIVASSYSRRSSIEVDYSRRGSSCESVSSKGSFIMSRRRKVFESTPETELRLKGVATPVLARGFRLSRQKRRTSEIQLTSLCRNHIRSDRFERKEVGAVASCSSSVQSSLKGGCDSFGEETDSENDDEDKHSEGTNEEKELEC